MASGFPARSGGGGGARSTPPSSPFIIMLLFWLQEQPCHRVADRSAAKYPSLRIVALHRSPAPLRSTRSSDPASGSEPYIYAARIASESERSPPGSIHK